jgi:hypothetical protein
MKKIYLFFKSLVLCLLVKKNREIGLIYTLKTLEVLDYFAKKTETKKDDKAAKYLIEKLESLIILNNKLNVDKVGTAIVAINNEKKGLLKDVSIGINQGKISVKVGKGQINYKPKDGSLELALIKKL